MKKSLTALFTLIVLTICIPKVFAACPCQTSPPSPATTAPCQTDLAPASPCPTVECPCDCNKTSETWLCPENVEAGLRRLGFTECQKNSARQAIEEFKCAIKDLPKCCRCESKCDCKKYRMALNDLDCKMKNIITRCQKKEYDCIREEVKKQVQCCHKCLMWPKKCKCGCKG